jgi:hypothetical protein
MLSHFDFKALNDPDFKEDAVREEILVPIIKALGYQVTGDNRVVRSKTLAHPFVSIGSSKQKISVIPDYVFLSEGKPHWVLDAKAPNESVLKSSHAEQAYSYAIHAEIRAEYFALCNGRKFALWSTRNFEPLVVFEVQEIEKHWDKLFRMLHPELKARPEVIDYDPDYGLHLMRLGAKPKMGLVLLSVNANVIAKLGDNQYTVSTILPFETNYLVSLDFGEKQLQELLSVLPEKQVQLLKQGLSHQPFCVRLENGNFQFGAYCELTEAVVHNKEESYLPFKVLEFVAHVNL